MLLVWCHLLTTVLIRFNFLTELTNSLDLFRSKKSVRLNDFISYDKNNLFYFKNINLFDLNSDVNVIEVKDNKQIYYNIFSFIN